MVFSCSSSKQRKQTNEAVEEKIGAVSQAKKQHRLAVNLLRKLGLDNVRLVRQPDGYFHYHAWGKPLAVSNGSAGKVKRGKIRLQG
jgi:hypothetical protein